MLFTKFSEKNIHVEYAVGIHTKSYFLFLTEFLLIIKTEGCDSSIQRADFADAKITISFELGRVWRLV